MNKGEALSSSRSSVYLVYDVGLQSPHTPLPPIPPSPNHRHQLDSIADKRCAVKTPMKKRPRKFTVNRGKKRRIQGCDINFGPTCGIHMTKAG